ncbi:hypothetical protein ABZ693_30370, partial [Streptomyces laurentii]
AGDAALAAVALLPEAVYVNGVGALLVAHRELARPLEEAKKARLRSAQRAGQLDPGADLDWSSTCSTRPSSRGGCTAALR